MQQKKSILVRTYLVFVGLALFCMAILGKAIYIQLAEGALWQSVNTRDHIRFENVEADRGTIYSEDGQVLSTSVPEFDVYIDFMANGLRERNGWLFTTYADSLAIGLAKIFGDKTAAAYKKELYAGFKKKQSYVLFKRKISFKAHEQLQALPLVKLGRNKSGFISVVRTKRLYPFRTLANRTIGIARDSNKVGLERAYDGYLSGVTGKRLVRTVGGARIPIEGSEEDPKNGADINTTINVNMQDVAQEALRSMMESNEALNGTCIVMEVKTGKIRAMANLGRMPNGTYAENYNYALSATEPGSTWKLVTLLSVLEDNMANLSTMVNLEGGRWNVAGETVFDSEIHNLYQATVLQAFEKSSNVGMAKLAYQSYYNQPSKFLTRIHALHLDSLTGVDLPGESKPNIHKPGTQQWSNTTLPWMGFGYNLTITPLATAMLYNAVANKGKMMRPYLVNAIIKDGVPIKTILPVVLNEKICSDATLQQLQTSLEGVVTRGTGSKLQTPAYTIAGKTGTSLVADKGVTYLDKMYQSSFAGYMPANDPQYTIVVVIRNKAHAAKFYGADVAGPVFRQVSDQLFTYCRRPQSSPAQTGQKSDSVNRSYIGKTSTLKKILLHTGINAADSGTKPQGIASLTIGADAPSLKASSATNSRSMPALIGLGLKDAIDLCESRGLTVTINGKGKVHQQSITEGAFVSPGQTIHLQLN